QQSTALSLDDQNLQCAAERTVFDHKGRRIYHFNSETLEMSHYRVEEFQLLLKSQLTFLKRKVFYGWGPLHLLQCLGDCGRLFTCRQRGFQNEPS
ncbi:hypothetical protein D917_08342, partial [Trichinella nativa]